MKASDLGLREFEVDFGTFDYRVCVLIGPWQNVRKFVEWKLNGKGDHDDFPPRGMVFFKDGYSPILWLPAKPRGPARHGVLAHEAFHIVCRLMAWVRIPLTRETEEAYAHAISHLVERILEELR